MNSNQRGYSAGAVKHAFWFMEFRKVVTLRQEGKAWGEIKKKNEKENLFGAPTPARAKQIWNTVSARINALDDGFYPIFTNGDLSTQKLFALIATMANDRLFAEFVCEVIREKMIIGINEYSPSVIRLFFKHKQEQSEKAAGWTDQALERLGQSYRNFLYEAGRMKEFEEAFEDEYGKSWKENRHKFDFIQDTVVDVLADMDFMSEHAARNWCEKAAEPYQISIEDFAKRVKAYIDSKGKNHHVVFLVDEIGQYIGEDSKLMLNLQTVTEELGKECKGKTWVIVTSQQDIICSPRGALS